MKLKESHLFFVRNTTFSQPVFYVEASDILEATKIAKEIVEIINNEKVIGTISVVEVPLLRLEEN